MIFFMFYALFGVLTTPVFIRFDASLAKKASGMLTIGIWGVSLVYHLGLVRNAMGEMTVEIYRNGSLRHFQREAGNALQSALAVINTVFKGNRMRSMLKKSLHILRVRVLVRISFTDAAATAQATAGISMALNQLSRYFKRHHIRHAFRAWPDFSAKGSAFQGNCILFSRLGNLLFVGILAGLLHMRESRSHKEARKWNTRLET